MAENVWGDEEIMGGIRAQARLEARSEIASLCGLVLRRLQDSPDAPLATRMASAFSEALREFGGTDEEPGA